MSKFSLRGRDRFVSEDDLRRFAESVRDQAQHAAVSAPLHGEDPNDAIEKIDLDSLLTQAFGDGSLPPEAIEIIAGERRHQETLYDAKHDANHLSGQLAFMAACYASPSPIFIRLDYADGAYYKDAFPWSPLLDHRRKTDMGSDLERRLILLARAGALVAAEMDRLMATPEGQKLLESLREFQSAE